MVSANMKVQMLNGATGVFLAPLVGIASVSTAGAADLPSRKAPVVAPVMLPSWAGLYAGINVGVGSQHSSDNFPDWQGSRTGTSFVGGGQIGYNWQQGTFVYGLEADISGLSKPHTYYQDPNGPTYGSHVSWMSTVRARLGVTVGDGNTLLYATGGLAVGAVSAHSNELPTWNADNGYSKTRAGWTIGAGVEHKLNANWSVGLEGLFADLGKYRAASTDGGKCCSTIHNTVLLGRLKLNYKF